MPCELQILRGQNCSYFAEKNPVMNVGARKSLGFILSNLLYVQISTGGLRVVAWVSSSSYSEINAKEGREIKSFVSKSHLP